jgi:N-acetylmuramoyl-L-alanine amidase
MKTCVSNLSCFFIEKPLCMLHEGFFITSQILQYSSSLYNLIMRSYTRLLLVLVMFAACNRPAYYQTNKAYNKQVKQLAKQLRQQPAAISEANQPPYWVGTTNFNLRKPNIVVIHHTAQNSCDSTLRTFTLPRTQVSAHYVICKDGTVHHMLNDYLRAWHAGSGKWGSVTDVNSTSIGIELDNNGFEPFPEQQINSLLTVLDTLKRKYSIPTQNFIGHADIAPTRKVDPNKYFPWKQLATRGFGNWFESTADSLPSNFNTLLALKIVGYDIKDTTAAISSFKRKFFAVEKTSPMLTDEEKKALFSLMKKAM